jgi:uncharacterized protein YjbJ (UPF0337 family)
MRSGTKDRIAGTAHDVKGKVKEEVGHLASDPGLEAKGIVEQIAGKVQKKVGDLEKAVDTP